MILTPMVIADAPTCSTPNAPIAITNATTPVYPDAPRDFGVGEAHAFVRVTINADGSLAKAAIERTSGNIPLDQAALVAIRASSYSPAIQNCSPTSAATTVDVDMVPNGTSRILPRDAMSACDIPNAEATVTNPVFADYPDSQRNSTNRHVVVVVKVTVAPNGSVANVEVAQSSGVDDFDRVVLRAARQSAYLPKIVNCGAVIGTYLFRTEFNKL